MQSYLDQVEIFAGYDKDLGCEALVSLVGEASRDRSRGILGPLQYKRIRTAAALWNVLTLFAVFALARRMASPGAGR